MRQSNIQNNTNSKSRTNYSELISKSTMDRNTSFVNNGSHTDRRPKKVQNKRQSITGGITHRESQPEGGLSMRSLIPTKHEKLIKQNKAIASQAERKLGKVGSSSNIPTALKALKEFNRPGAKSVLKDHSVLKSSILVSRLSNSQSAQSFHRRAKTGYMGAPLRIPSKNKGVGSKQINTKVSKIDLT